jgi:hypothetical protein
MVKRSIPSYRRASSLTLTRCSRLSKASFEADYSLFTTITWNQNWGFPGLQVPGATGLSTSCRLPASSGCRYSRRVMGAWWPPRSSKPSSVRFTGRGKFDSYPLRHNRVQGSSAIVPAAQLLFRNERQEWGGNKSYTERRWCRWRVSKGSD